MTVAEMCAQVNFNIAAIYTTKSFLDSVILKELNRVLKEIAGAYYLPVLIKSKTVQIEGEEDDVKGWEAKVRLPSDYDHDLFRARNETQEADITIFPNVAAMKEHYSGSTLTGSVEAIAWDGAYIWGLLCPETEEDITIEYYQIPDDLVAGGEGPGSLPVRLHEGLLVDGATARILKRIPEEVAAGGPNMKYHLAEQAEALEKLNALCEYAPKTKPYYKRDIQYF